MPAVQLLFFSKSQLCVNSRRAVDMNEKLGHWPAKYFQSVSFTLRFPTCSCAGGSLSQSSGTQSSRGMVVKPSIHLQHWSLLKVEGWCYHPLPFAQETANLSISVRVSSVFPWGNTIISTLHKCKHACIGTYTGADVFSFLAITVTLSLCKPCCKPPTPEPHWPEHWRSKDQFGCSSGA